MAYQKVCKQDRDVIKVKVNTQSPIPTSLFALQLYSSVKKRCKDRALYIYLHFITTLPCLHTFWRAISTFFYIFNVFIVLYIYVYICAHVYI